MRGGGRSRSRTRLHSPIPCFQGKEQGKLQDLATARFLATSQLNISMAYEKFPDQGEQGIIFKDQGLFVHKQRFWSPRTEFVAD
jgi:hypothetical protein